MKYIIREIELKDNKKIEKIIRDCLIEFGANHAGTAWTDPNLGNFSNIYNDEKNKYWIAEEIDDDGNMTGKLLGGVGVGILQTGLDVCELQKMYCIKEARGKKVAQDLIDIALSYAKNYYKKCYLETLDNMIAAQKFYEKNGFERTFESIVQTEHFACDVKYIKKLD